MNKEQLQKQLDKIKKLCAKNDGYLDDYGAGTDLQNKINKILGINPPKEKIQTPEEIERKEYIKKLFEKNGYNTAISRDWFNTNQKRRKKLVA